MSVHPSRDTTPELKLRSELWRRGLRYRVCWPVPGLRRRSIDVAFTRKKVAVFLDGCFWHGCPMHGRQPVANASWWATKLARNTARDAETTQHLHRQGWAVLRFWEHEEVVVMADAVVEALGGVHHVGPQTTRSPAPR